jgi:histone deacetylase 1/2
MENNTWTLSTPPTGRNAIGSKWIFKVKCKPDGSVDRYKARLVAQGFSQSPGVDYEETYSPVVHRSSLRALLSYGIERGMFIHQMDVVTAFLNGTLTEEIYMKQPDGFISPGNEDLVCKLNRSLYGLKQSPRCWNLVLDEFLKSLGFSPSSADQCVYTRDVNGVKTILAVYVDDIVILSDSEQSIQEIKKSLCAKFKMKDLEHVHFCLGINAEFNGTQLKLHQTHYIRQILEKFGMSHCKTASTPMATDVQLVKDDGSKQVNQQLYQSVIGSLLYVSTATRPDIAYSVGVLSKFNCSPTETHLTAAKRVLRYLNGTIDHGIIFSKSSDEPPVGYADANWAENDENRHSTSGNVFIASNGPISWLSKRQSKVALSSTESEYI